MLCIASIDQVTDEQLIDRARDGDTAAFGELVDRHRSAVVRATRAALETPDEADDVAQEAFVAAWRGLATFRGEASFRTWVLTIAWRLATSRRRARAHRWWSVLSRASNAGRSESGSVDVASPAASHEQVLLDREFAEAVRAAVHSLKPRLRDPLVLAASGEYSMEEIATMLGAPVGTIKWRVSEARRLTKEKLERMTGARR